MKQLWLLALGILAWSTALVAQTNTDWITREQDAMWIGVFLDQPVSQRTSLWFDASWRRMNFGAQPQQLLVRPGVLVTVAPGVRVGGGVTYVASAPYGSLPAANPSRDYRTWQTLQLAHSAGKTTVNHRLILEQRWIRSVFDDSLGPLTYANRIRYRGRGQRQLGTATLHAKPVYGFVWDELLMPIGGAAQQFTLGQNRAAIGVGLPISKTVTAEVGYMNLYNAFPARRANEVNHTLWISWHYTGKRAD